MQKYIMVSAFSLLYGALAAVRLRVSVLLRIFSALVCRCDIFSRYLSLRGPVREWNSAMDDFADEDEECDSDDSKEIPCYSENDEIAMFDGMQLEDDE